MYVHLTVAKNQYSLVLPCQVFRYTLHSHSGVGLVHMENTLHLMPPKLISLHQGGPGKIAFFNSTRVGVTSGRPKSFSYGFWITCGYCRGLIAENNFPLCHVTLSHRVYMGSLILTWFGHLGTESRK